MKSETRRHLHYVMIGALVAALLFTELWPDRHTSLLVFIAVIGLSVLYQFGELGWVLVKGVCWLAAQALRLVRRALSGGRTTPDRSGP